MHTLSGGRRPSFFRGTLALLGACTIGVAALAGCGSSDGGGSSASPEDCEALNAAFVNDIVVDSFALDEDKPDVTQAQVVAAVEALPDEYQDMGRDAVELFELSSRLEADAKASPDDFATLAEEAQTLGAEFEDEYADEWEAATYWAADQCAGDRVVWACFDGNTKANFRLVGTAIGAEGAPSVDPSAATPEEAIDVEGWTEVLRNDAEAVFARLDDDGRAVQVRTAEYREADEYTEEGWGQVFDIGCDTSDPEEDGGGGFEPVGDEIVTTTEGS